MRNMRFGQKKVFTKSEMHVSKKIRPRNFLFISSDQLSCVETKLINRLKEDAENPTSDHKLVEAAKDCEQQQRCGDVINIPDVTLRPSSGRSSSIEDLSSLVLLRALTRSVASGNSFFLIKFTN